MKRRKSSVFSPKRREWLISILVASTISILPSLSIAKTNHQERQVNMRNQKILIVFYSRTNHTKTLAQHIHAQVGGDILEINTAPPYPEDYDAAVNEARLELLTGQRRPLQAITIDISTYDVVFLGSPRWWNTLSVPMLSFITGHDLGGKTIIPFNTHAGGSREKTFEDLLLLCPDSKVLEGLSLNGTVVQNAQNQVQNWLRSINMLAQ